MVNPADIVAAAVMVLQGQQAPVQQFPDVPEGHWAYEAVLNMRREAIFVGYPPEPRRTEERD